MTTFFLIVALVIALGAGVWAWSLQREVGRLTRRLDRYNKALFDAADELRDLREQIAENGAALRVVTNRQLGQLHFEPEMTVREAQKVHPQVQEVLAGFHVGGCSSCAVEPDDSLQSVATSKGIPLEKLLNTLNLLVAAPDGRVYAENGGSRAAAAPVRVKLPNVSLDFE